MKVECSQEAVCNENHTIRNVTISNVSQNQGEATTPTHQLLEYLRRLTRSVAACYGLQSLCIVCRTMVVLLFACTSFSSLRRNGGHDWRGRSLCTWIVYCPTLALRFEMITRFKVIMDREEEEQLSKSNMQPSGGTTDDRRYWNT